MEAASTCQSESGTNHQRDCVRTCLYARAVNRVTLCETIPIYIVYSVERMAEMERPYKAKIVCSSISSLRRVPRTCLFTFIPSGHPSSSAYSIGQSLSLFIVGEDLIAVPLPIQK